jgi:hypothetical protein
VLLDFFSVAWFSLILHLKFLSIITIDKRENKGFPLADARFFPLGCIHKRSGVDWNR